jgi:hypothetical protein
MVMVQSRSCLLAVSKRMMGGRTTNSENNSNVMSNAIVFTIARCGARYFLSHILVPYLLHTDVI